MSDIVIKAESLGKKYRIGHMAERVPYMALRDVWMQNAKIFWNKTKDLFSGKPVIQGDTQEEVWAIRDVSFEIHRGEAVGIIGRNGAGKSTLLKVLSRITEPSAGRLTIKGRVASLLEVGTGFHPELSGRENIYLNGTILGMTRLEIKRKFDEIVAFADVEKYLDTPVKRYSSGMYLRLAFSVAAHLEPEILVVDEVLAVGDIEFQKKCLGKMSDVTKEGRTILFVSHNMAAIAKLCNLAILLERGLVRDTGTASDVVSAYLSGSQNLNPVVEFPRNYDTPIQYISASIRDMSGRSLSKLLDSDWFIIDLEVKASEFISNVYFGLILRNSHGIDVLFADSRDTEESVAEIITPGLHCYRLKFPYIFSPDTYSVSIGIGDRLSLHSFHNVESALSFEIVQSRNFQRAAKRPGIINLSLSWEEHTKHSGGSSPTDTS